MKMQSILFLLVAFPFAASVAAAGEWKPIADPSEPVVQSIAVFAVREYNKGHALKLSYDNVMSGEAQVFSGGFNYRLQINATDSAGNTKLCEAFVWSNPWALVTKLVYFKILK